MAHYRESLTDSKRERWFRSGMVTVPCKLAPLEPAGYAGQAFKPSARKSANTFVATSIASRTSGAPA